MHRMIIFDIDGTLLMTGGAGKSAFNSVFAELYQISEAWQDILPDGRTDPSLIKEIFQKNLGYKPETKAYQKVAKIYIEKMEQALQAAPRFRLLPGITDLLETLFQRYPQALGIATGNFEDSAQLKLKRAGLENYFSFGGFGSDSEDRLALTRKALERGRQALKRWIPPEDVFLVGDTPHDIRCGKLLGMNTVAVASGSHSKKELSSYQPDFLLQDFSQVEEVISIFEI
ncbi:MAG: HAD family hydrolase [Deltaproteobacteria bacterium]|nr:HAD family hydrolase [Deltaproteobacteria bacterium]